MAGPDIGATPTAAAEAMSATADTLQITASHVSLFERWTATG